jgi:hypothetical protein
MTEATMAAKKSRRAGKRVKAAVGQAAKAARDAIETGRKKLAAARRRYKVRNAARRAAAVLKKAGKAAGAAAAAAAVTAVAGVAAREIIKGRKRKR